MTKGEEENTEQTKETTFVRILDVNESEPIEVPVEADGCLLLSTVSIIFPSACGLKYTTNDGKSWRVVRVVDDKLFPSEGSWENVDLYYVVYPRGKNGVNHNDSVSAADTKRKVDDDGKSQFDNKLRRVDESKNSRHINDEIDSNSVDLIVLGVNFKSTEQTLKDYFSKYGNLELCEIKRDLDGNSRGFAFIRFESYEPQEKVLTDRRHLIDGRTCYVKIPDSSFSNGSRSNPSLRKIFVARLPQGTTSDDLRNHFSRFGDIMDVYMSQPFRSFAFVTFRNADCVPFLFKQQHKINDQRKSDSDNVPLSKRPYFSIDDNNRSPRPPSLPNQSNIDMTSMASMLTPAMMATFLNMAAVAQDQANRSFKSENENYKK